MLAVFKKELKSYFLSPIGYVAIGLFLLVFSLFFYLTTIYQRAIDMGNLYFNTARYGLLVIVPIITMRMFAEERKNGTEQLLLTSPKSITGIVFGKLVAAIALIAITLIISLMYYVILCFFQAPNIVPVLVMILGFLLLSIAAISLGMFASSITENQVISAIITIVFLVIPWFLPNFGEGFEIIDLMSSYQKFPAGVISIQEVVRLVSFAAVFILITIMIMQRRKSVK
ncbi:MAG: ABC transporter permease subunit [Clostridia bacterium]|nr:ABC transporter permease subunit [Clostridia bacterium]